jgi:hypothetical protein
MRLSTPENNFEAIAQEIRKILQTGSPFDETKILIQLDQAQSSLPDNREIAELREAVLNHARKLRGYQKYSEVKSQCESLWGQEQNLLKSKTNPQRILQECYEAARKIAEMAYVESPEFLPLEGLKNDAQIQYDRARLRYQIKTTADRIHDYREQVSILENEPDKEREIPWADDRGQFIESIKVRDAIDSLTKDAQSFAHIKSQKYVQLADDYVRNHQPRLAHEELEKGKNLYLLPSEDENRLNKFDQSIVQPELKKLEEAEQLLQLAQLTTEPDKSLQKVEQALLIYPWVGGVDEIKKSIISRIQASLLIRAEMLINEKQYTEATSVLEVLPEDSKRQKLFADLSAQIKKERSVKVAQWEKSLVDRRKQVTAYFLASLATSILVLCLLIAGGIFILLGQVSSGVIFSISSSIPAAVTKILVDTYKELRNEQRQSLEKTSHEVDLENKILEKKND